MNKLYYILWKLNIYTKMYAVKPYIIRFIRCVYVYYRPSLFTNIIILNVGLLYIMFHNEILNNFNLVLN